MTNLPQIHQDVWKPATEAEKSQALVMLASLPSRATSSAALDKAGYYIALEGVTRHGLFEAVKAILKGALSHAFFPSPPELRIQCDKAMEWHEAYAERIRRRERENAEFKRQQLGEPILRTAEGRARQQASYAAYCAAHGDSERKRIEAQEREDVRARYGMTDEVLAGIKDSPNPAERTKKSA